MTDQVRQRLFDLVLNAGDFVEFLAQHGQRLTTAQPAVGVERDDVLGDVDALGVFVHLRPTTATDERLDEALPCRLVKASTFSRNANGVRAGGRLTLARAHAAGVGAKHVSP